MDHIGEWETRGLLGDRVGLEIPLLKKKKFLTEKWEACGLLDDDMGLHGHKYPW
jgi:hypothetical protein